MTFRKAEVHDSTAFVRAGILSKEPDKSLTVGCFDRRDLAGGEVGSRVRPWMVMFGDEGWLRRALITAEPCWPVAPAMKIVWVMVR